MVSLSDILTPLGWTTTQVIWELRMEQLDGDQCRYTNTVTSHPTEDFLEFITEQGRRSPKPPRPDKRHRDDIAGSRHPCMRRVLPGGRPPTLQRHFSNLVSLRDLLTCDDASCLTRCHRAFVSNSCHFFRTPLSIPLATYAIGEGRGQPVRKVPSRDGIPRGAHA